jgi:hypothetical protein
MLLLMIHYHLKNTFTKMSHLDPKKIQNYMPPILIRATHKNIMYIYVSLFAFSRTLVHIFRDLKLCIIR